MKLWTTLELERLPHVLRQGFDNPYSEEIIFWNIPEIGAENALSFEGELAFIEAEIPDGKLDEYFTRCMASWGDDTTAMASNLEHMMEEGAPADEISALQKLIERAEVAETGSEGFEIFGYACLAEVLPPEMLKILDPSTMLEAVHSGDVNAVAQAVETAEATPFKSLSAAFWVWLITIMSQIFGPGYGIQEPSEAQEAAEEAEAEQLEKRREKASKRPRKKKGFKVKKKKASTGA